MYSYIYTYILYVYYMYIYMYRPTSSAVSIASAACSLKTPERVDRLSLQMHTRLSGRRVSLKTPEPHAPLKHQRKSVNTLNTLIVHAQMHTEGVDRCASVNTLSVHLEGQSDCPSKCTRGFQGGVSAPLITYFSHIKTRPRYKDREKVGEFE